MTGYLDLTLDPNVNPKRIRGELNSLQTTGVKVFVEEDSLNTIGLEAETLDLLTEAKRAVELIIGVWLVLLYLGKEALAALLHPELREGTIGA